MEIEAVLLKVPPPLLPPTVSRKLLLAVAPLPSVTVIVIVELPLCPAAGVMVTVRLAPLPPKTILLVGARVGLDDCAERRRLATGVSASPIVNGIAGVGVLMSAA